MLLAVLAAVAAGWLTAPGRGGLRRLRGQPVGPGDAVGAGTVPGDAAAVDAVSGAAPRSLFDSWPAWVSAPLLAATAAGLAVTRFVDGPVGWLAGVAVAGGFLRWFQTLEGAAERLRQEQMVRDLPLVVDLLVACLRAGRAVSDALDAVADAWSGPLSRELRTASAQLALGGDPVAVWRTWANDPALEPLARAFARAARSGASVTATLEHAATDLRQRRRWAGQARARSVGVHTAAPLGLCFMPAFIVLGVVPTVIGTFSNSVL